MIVDEALTGHVVQVVVTAGNTTTADVEFANDAYGQFVAVAIDDEFLDIELWTAYRHAVGMGEFLDVRRHGGLRWTIGVQDARRSELLHLVQEALGQFLATEADNGNGADGLDELRAIDPGLPLRRCCRHVADMVLVDESGHVERVLGLLLVGQYQGKAVEQRDSNLMERGVERDGGDGQDALGSVGYGIGLDVGGQCRGVVAHSLVAQHHTLWTSR